LKQTTTNWQWWAIEATDADTGDSWVFRVPAESEREAVERLWRFGFVTGTPTLSPPVIDPAYRAAADDAKMIHEMTAGGWSWSASQRGTVWKVSTDHSVTIERVIAATALEADPDHRNHMFHGVINQRDYPGMTPTRSQILWACWQWLLEWPTYREQWLRKEKGGDCMGIPQVVCPDFLREEMEARGSPARAKWLKSVVDKLDRMQHRNDPPRLKLW